jgi:DNA-directed RNA polymerase specialized sigma24 family protein
MHDPSDDALDRLAAVRALAKLSPEDRACVLLHAALGLRYYEIGKVLGLSDDAARQRITRAKARFRRHYESES